MKKRNKKYNPNKHRVVVNAMYQTVRLAKPVSDEAKVELKRQTNAALSAITRGVGTPEHFDVLASTVDVVFMMAMNLFNDAYQSEIDAARQAMFRLKDRFHKHGTFGFDGVGYKAVAEIVAIHDQMMDHVTGSEVLQFMNARANAIRGGNYYKGESERLAA
ncbi:hypothetical protein [Methylotenera sp.]|uniref:hypothetical protein n=1 Tax=Methylotenera sp. TaxID=2051956 RepID=UPI002EDAE744